MAKILLFRTQTACFNKIRWSLLWVCSSQFYLKKLSAHRTIRAFAKTLTVHALSALMDYAYFPNKQMVWKNQNFRGFSTSKFFQVNICFMKRFPSLSSYWVARRMKVKILTQNFGFQVSIFFYFHPPGYSTATQIKCLKSHWKTSKFL